MGRRQKIVLLRRPCAALFALSFISAAVFWSAWNAPSVSAQSSVVQSQKEQSQQVEKNQKKNQQQNTVQKNNPQKNQAAAGNWLLTKIPASQQNVYGAIREIMREGIMPRGIDRNERGDFLVVSQRAPPAPTSKTWVLVRYKSEKEMMTDLRTRAVDGWSPAGMDVQGDGAFVQYVQNGMQPVNARLIKIKDPKEIENTLTVYRDLNFLPAALSTFEDQLWFLFMQYENLSASDYEITVKSADALTMDALITAGLTEAATLISDMTLTDDGKVIIIFTQKTSGR